MDELDLLKKDWQKEDKSYPKLSYNEIYKMILKKSSSIVKWIFIISLLEFGFWVFLSFIMKSFEFSEQAQQIESATIFKVIMVISYFVLAYFFYLFYTNYRKITSTDTTKALMENIIKTRRTVKQYVFFNLASVIIGTIIGIFHVFKHDPKTLEQINQAAANGEVFKFYASFIIATVIMLGIALALLLLFYWLVYGILLKRLNSNYNELKKLEV